MTPTASDERDRSDRAPGDDQVEGGVVSSIRGYVIGLGLATLLTIASFIVATGDMVWAAGVPMALVVLSLAQIGVHLVFFLHITTGPDSTNNVLALAFGVLVVALVMLGSLWIMANLNANMMPMDEIILRQR